MLQITVATGTGVHGVFALDIEGQAAAPGAEDHFAGDVNAAELLWRAKVQEHILQLRARTVFGDVQRGQRLVGVFVNWIIVNELPSIYLEGGAHSAIVVCRGNGEGIGVRAGGYRLSGNGGYPDSYTRRYCHAPTSSRCCRRKW